MKSPDFEYVKAKNIEDVFASLHTYKDSAQILAGGQSLLAMLNLRMANPQILIDISGINTMKGIEKLGNTLRIGALTTHNDILNSDLVKLHVPPALTVTEPVPEILPFKSVKGDPESN